MAKNPHDDLGLSNLGSIQCFSSSPQLAVPDTPERERAHAIWDHLADIDAAQVEEALEFLLGSLCELVDAQNADWFGAVRLPDSLKRDPVHGWRPTPVRYLHPTEKLLEAVREQTRKLEHGQVNEVVVRMVSMAGRFRACRLRDLMPPQWFGTPFYQEYYRDCGHDDAIYVAFPINGDIESYFGIFRGVGQPPFSAAQRDAVAYALRGIKWFHRHLMLSHGFLIAQAPLTPVERRVLQQLLTGAPEKHVAAEVGQSYHTTHEYVTAIYRKFGVGNRPALMALWLGSGA